MFDSRYSRHAQIFGAAGQDSIAAATFCVVGLGGTGSHVVQQLAYLGARKFRLIDSDVIDETSMNRVVTAKAGDAEKSLLKVEAASRLILGIQPAAEIVSVPKSLMSREGFDAVRDSSIVVGCVDRDFARLILNELCQAHRITLVDIATDVDRDNPGDFGGRVHISKDGLRCLSCDGLLDHEQMRADSSSEVERETENRIYGVAATDLHGSGPSVVSINGLLASAAVTEIVVDLTGLRKPVPWLEYRGLFGGLFVKQEAPQEHCYYCKGSAIRGRGIDVDIERYLPLESRGR